MSKNVYQLIAQVAAEMSKDGIAKDRNNAQQGYKFRGIDDVYNALAPVISKAGLVIIPRMISREFVERVSASNKAIFYVVVEAEFDFISSFDSTKHTARTFGEAMDSADKATNKAMSAAYKYACLQAFCIPTEGDNDAEGSTHSVEHEPKKSLTPDMTAIWKNAKEAFVRDKNLNKVLERYNMSQEHQDKLISECNNAVA